MFSFPPSGDRAAGTGHFQYGFRAGLWPDADTRAQTQSDLLLHGQTPVSVAAVRGTVFELSFEPDAHGEAQYRLSTSSGLVHVTPHSGRAVSVAANGQVNLSAELGKNGVKIKRVKSSKLGRQKRNQIEKEALDNERTAGELVKRLPPPGAKAKRAAADHPSAIGNTPRDATPDTGTDKVKPVPGQPVPAQPGSRDDPKAAKPATPTPKPTIKPEAPKPKTPREPPTKRPPRRPGP